MKTSKEIKDKNEKYYKEKFENSGHLPDKNTFPNHQENPGTQNYQINNRR
ncbi:hypothetical protein [Clostridium senegalense]|nr:hypothetical protein [Clostridium senegalense]MBU5228170.1 hypothetical protein [Clostridium senegalense]